MTCKKLGSTHAELVLPLVTQLLEIHPFFDTPEPDIEDPAYLCILVLVFNAAEHCPTLGPLLDEVSFKIHPNLLISAWLIIKVMLHPLQPRPYNHYREF